MNDETTIAIAGDWHGRTSWMGIAIPSIHRADARVRTLLHLGDLWTDRKTLDTIDHHAQRAGIERVLLTSGNHDRWDELNDALAAADGEPARLSKTVYVLPRPYRFEISGRSFLSLGGAASIDREDGIEGRDWWPEETISDEMVAAAIAGGPADIMLTHESPAQTPVRAVRRVFDQNRLKLSQANLALSAASRQQVEAVWDTVRPRMLFHGHIHEPGAGTTEDGRRVFSLGCDGQRGNVELLDLESLELTTVDVRSRRDR